MSVVVVIPFRDRGRDPLRRANLDVVLAHWRQWRGVDVITVSEDGRTGDEQFNRSAAYNRAVAAFHADVYVFAESDVIVDHAQVDRAVEMARSSPGLVVPFNQYRYLGPNQAADVRLGFDPAQMTPEWTMDNGRSVGALNVVSRATLDAVGRFDEAFEGSWYDDRAMSHAFAVAAGRSTRYVEGPAYHLFHVPGWRGDHLTEADRQATARNRRRLAKYRHADTPQRIRELTTGAAL